MRPYKLSFGLMILAVTIIWASCEYNLESENFRILHMPDTTQTIQIELSPEDSFYLITSPVFFHYNLNTFDLKVYNVEVFLDEFSVYKGTEPEATFAINPDGYGTGDRVLTLVITTNTNTRSVADLIGWEGLVFMMQWKVHVDGANPGPVEISRIFNDSGLLKLEWEPYERLNFQKYRIWVNYPEFEGSFFYHLLDEISDPDKTWWYDSTYIGGSPDYWIEVMASEQYASGGRTRVSYPYPELDTLWQKGDSAYFCWNRHLFYRAFDKYVLSTTQSPYPYSEEVLFTSNNVDDTTFVIRNMRFGKAMGYILSCSAKKLLALATSTNTSSYKRYVGIGKAIPEFTAIKSLFTYPILYLQNYEVITKITFPESSTLLQMTDMLTTNWTISPDDKYIFTWKGSDLKKLDSHSLAVLSTYDMYLPENPKNISSISLKETMIDWQYNGCGLYDFANDRYIFSGKNQGLHGAEISPDGEYSFTRQYNDGGSTSIIVNKVTDTCLVECWKLPDGNYGIAGWIQEDFSKLFVIQEGQYANPPQPERNIVKIYDPSDQSVIYELQIRKDNFCGIDPESGSLAVWDVWPGTDDKNKVYLYNYRTGILDLEINLAPRFDILTLYKSHLISSGGFCLNISEQQ